MLGNYNCDYTLEGNLPGDRQRSVTKKERDAINSFGEGVERCSVGKNYKGFRSLYLESISCTDCMCMVSPLYGLERVRASGYSD